MELMIARQPRANVRLLTLCTNISYPKGLYFSIIRADLFLWHYVGYFRGQNARRYQQKTGSQFQ